MIKNINILVLAVALNACSGSGSDKVTSNPVPSSSSQSSTVSSEASSANASAINNWQLVWSDEFDGSLLDTAKWSYEENCKGNGDELQCYTSRPENVSVSDGNLHIKVRKENFSGPAVWNDEPGYDSKDKSKTLGYTSGRLRTQFKGDWTYGRIEVKAKLPGGQGMWPAAWMLPSDWKYGEWPASGEIDIVEAFNNNAINDSPVYGTLHYGVTWPGFHGMTGTTYKTSQNLYDFYHTYALEWEADEMRWYVDDIHYATQTKDGWFTAYTKNGEKIISHNNEPFEQRFHVLLNVAVTGSTSASTFPQEMTVDYVRVYKCPLDEVNGKGCAMNVNPSIKPLQGIPKNSFSLFADGPSTLKIPVNGTATNFTPTVKTDSTDVVANTLTEGNGEVWDLQFNGTTASAYLSWADNNKVIGLEPGFNLSPIWDLGELQFDMLVESLGDATSLKVQLDSGAYKTSYYAFTNLQKGNWQTYSIPFANLLANKSPVGSVNSASVINPFVITASGGKAHIKLNNIRLVCRGTGCGFNPIYTGRTLTSSFDVFTDDIGPLWDNGLITYTDKPGSSHITVTTVDALADNRGKVLDAIWEDKPGQNSLFYIESKTTKDASSFSSDDYVSFDIKVLSYGSSKHGLVTSAWCNHPCASEFLALPDIPADDKWHNVTIPISLYVNTGLKTEILRQPFAFSPAWGDQGGVHVQLDNIRWIKRW